MLLVCHWPPYANQPVLGRALWHMPPPRHPSQANLPAFSYFPKIAILSLFLAPILDLFWAPGPIPGWRKNKRSPVKQPHQDPKIMPGLHWRSRKCQIWRSARCAMWTFMGFAGEGHQSRLSCEHTPGSGRLGCVPCPQRTLRLGPPLSGGGLWVKGCLAWPLWGPTHTWKWPHVEATKNLRPGRVALALPASELSASELSSESSL